MHEGNYVACLIACNSLARTVGDACSDRNPRLFGTNVRHLLAIILIAKKSNHNFNIFYFSTFLAATTTGTAHTDGKK